MYEIILDRKVIKFIQTLPQKHQRQIKTYILNLQEEPKPHDSQILKDYEPYRRGDCGEYRIVYRIDDSRTIYVLLVGKRNGGEVYQQLKNLLS